MAEHHQPIPHLENPFEEKAVEIGDERLASKMDDAIQENGDNQDSKDWIASEASMSPRTPSNTLENNPDEVYEDELNYISTDQRDQGGGRRNEDENSEAKVDIEPEEYGSKRNTMELRSLKDNTQQIDTTTDTIQSKTKATKKDLHVTIDEEAVQEALIQAAEDAMRYAYEETSRRQAAGITSSFEQHQLAEVLIRQRQGLMRLEELDNRIQSLESHLNKVVVHMLYTVSPTGSPVPSEIASPPRAYRDDSWVHRCQSIILTSWKIIPRVLESTKSSVKRMRDHLIITLRRTRSIGRDISSSLEQSGALATIHEVLFRINSRIRQMLGMSLNEGEQGLRHVYEGLEDRMILAGVVSGLLTLWFLMRYRQYRAVSSHSTLVKGLMPHTVPAKTRANSGQNPILTIT